MFLTVHFRYVRLAHRHGAVAREVGAIVSAAAAVAVPLSAAVGGAPTSAADPRPALFAPRSSARSAFA